MNNNTLEERGRFTLRALLWLILICGVAGQVLVYRPLDRESVLYITAALLPTAVALWALHRGSWPGLVLFFIGAFGAISGVTGALAEGSAALGSTALVVEFVNLLLRLTVIFCIFRGPAVGSYLAVRRSYRKRRDNVLEVGLFLAACAFQLGVLLWAANLLLHTNA